MQGSENESSSNHLLRQVEAHQTALRALADGSFDHSRAVRLGPTEAFHLRSEEKLTQPGTGTVPPLPEYPAVSDLIGLESDTFVEAAYRTLLGRSPDPSGRKYHLQNPEQGARTKVQILSELADSDEGRRFARPIRGLRAHSFIDRISRLPVLGYLAQWSLSFVRLPSTLRALEHRRALLARDVATLRQDLREEQRRLDEARAAIDLRAESSDLEDLANRLENASASHENAYRTLSSQIDQVRGRDPEIPADVLQRIEVHFRGKESGIKRHLETYLEHLPDPERVGNIAVDIGPGRGEWLGIAAAHGFDAVGIDNNPAVVDKAASLGHPIRLGEGIDQLRQMPTASCALISAFHVVEHIPFAHVLELVEEAHRVLTPGGVLILETPNPECLYVGACSFWNDPSHRAPLPPNLLEYLVASAGFRTETLRMNPSMTEADMPEDKDSAVALRWMFGTQDYAVIGTREEK